MLLNNIFLFFIETGAIIYAYAPYALQHKVR